MKIRILFRLDDLEDGYLISSCWIYADKEQLISINHTIELCDDYNTEEASNRNHAFIDPNSESLGF